MKPTTEPLAAAVAALRDAAAHHQHSANHQRSQVYRDMAQVKFIAACTPERIQRLCAAWVQLRDACEKARGMIGDGLNAGPFNYSTVAIEYARAVDADLRSALAGEPARVTPEDQ